ncbi:hypothetical protein BH10ACI1_BH10ACI1_10370 [soil metagenome]
MKASKIMKFVTAILMVFVLCVGFSVNLDAQTQDKSLEITNKPHPSARGCQGSGTARVRATFDKSGKVTQAELVLASSCVIFNQNSIEAARKIKFKPAIKDGEAITVTKLIEYAYQII